MPTVPLAERRPWVGRVPAADRAALRDHFRHAVEVAPAGGNRTRVTARGVAGWFRTPTILWVVRSKFPWADLTSLVADTPAAELPPGAPDAADRHAALLADRLAQLLDQQAARGFLRDYRVAAAESPAVQGRIDFARQSRRPRPAGDTLPLWRDEFTADVPWNQVPKRAASLLLDRPGLPPESRARLARAADPLAEVKAARAFPADWDAVSFDARTEAYRPLFDWCRVVAGALGEGGSQLLLPLERLWEDHLARTLAHPRVRRHPPLKLTASQAVPLTLVPDFVVVGRDGRPASVWDAKWKGVGRAGPEPGDVQQVLAYALLLGVKAGGLIVPGRRWGLRTYEGPNGVTLRVVRQPLAAGGAEASEKGGRLRRFILRRMKGL